MVGKSYGSLLPSGHVPDSYWDALECRRKMVTMTTVFRKVLPRRGSMKSARPRTPVMSLRTRMFVIAF